MRRIIWAYLVWVVTAAGALAQDLVWIQVEAQPSLREAEDRVRAYSSRLPDVAGFTLPNNWYVIALGPFDRPVAQARLRQLRLTGQVPSDSYIAQSSAYQSQFWPVGANQLTNLSPEQPTVAPTAPVAVHLDTPVALPDETPREAQQSERLLSRDERKDLQIALQWAGFYAAAIDGAFGRGTRRSMEEWQRSKGYEPTGILTTRQRAVLLRDYNAILDGMDLEVVTDTRAGIAMALPTGVVRFDRYDPPFAHYRSSGAIPAHVALISQEGSRDRFQGLFYLLQTLDMVPIEGPRKLTGDTFRIDAVDETYDTTIQVTYDDGVMKGFLMAWPAGDAQRRARVLAEMEASYADLDGVLPPSSAPATEDQRLDLLAGLEIRQPMKISTGFFVDAAGSVLTHSGAIGACKRITIGSEQDAEVTSLDAALGLAVLRPTAPTSPLDYATFQAAVPRLNDPVTVAGFSFGGVLGAPTLTEGVLQDLRGLSGEEDVKRLSVQTQPGDAGGPVFDRGGAVLGLLQPNTKGTRVLPQGTSFATDTDTIRDHLTKAGLSLRETQDNAVMTPAELSLMAADITVLVQCWD